MAWSKAKTTLIVAVILAAASTTGVVGYRAAQTQKVAQATKLPLLGSVFDVQADGTILAEHTFEWPNTSKETLGTNEVQRTRIPMTIERFTDGAGQPIRFKKLPGGEGDAFTYTYTLNQPVKPGDKLFMKMEGAIDGPAMNLIKPVGEPDVFELQQEESLGSEQSIHRRGVFRLPPGAVLLTKSPDDLAVTTNASQRVELRFDRQLPPPGSSSIHIRYRLGPAAR